MKEDPSELVVSEVLAVARQPGESRVQVLLRLATGLEARMVVPDDVLGTLVKKLTVQMTKPGFK